MGNIQVIGSNGSLTIEAASSLKESITRWAFFSAVPQAACPGCTVEDVESSVNVYDPDSLKVMPEAGARAGRIYKWPRAEFDVWHVDTGRTREDLERLRARVITIWSSLCSCCGATSTFEAYQAALQLILNGQGELLSQITVLKTAVIRCISAS